MRYGYLVVEGPHDIEFIARLIRPYGLHRVRLKRDLAPFWRYLVPKTFPYAGDLLRRVPVPLFFRSDTHSIAVHSARGDKELVNTLEETFMADPERMQRMVGVGLMLDADTKKTPRARFQSIKDQIATTLIPLAFPSAPGTVNQTYPKSGIYVVPDNRSPGTLEDILLECARRVYPDLLRGAELFIQNVDLTQLTGNDRRELRKPAGKRKATVSSIASVLKPGRAIQVSIQDNRWLREDAALNLPQVQTAQRFLVDLLELA